MPLIPLCCKDRPQTKMSLEHKNLHLFFKMKYYHGLHDSKKYYILNISLPHALVVNTLEFTFKLEHHVGLRPPNDVYAPFLQQFDLKIIDTKNKKNINIKKPLICNSLNNKSDFLYPQSQNYLSGSNFISGSTGSRT